MLGYIAKLFNTVLPSIVATVVGAYVVNYYVIPKPPVADGPPAVTAPAVPAKAVDGEPRAAAAPSRKDTSVKDQSAKPAATKPEAAKVEAVQPEKKDRKQAGEARKPANEPDKQDAVAVPAKGRDQAVTVDTPAKLPVATDPVDANAVYRAAIERQRVTAPIRTEVPRATVQSQPEPAPTFEPAPAAAVIVPSAVSPGVMAVQPLPPPVTLTPRQEAVREAQGAPEAGQGDDAALRPPGIVPQREGSARLEPVAPRGVTDDMLSAARSALESVISR